MEISDIDRTAEASILSAILTDNDIISEVMGKVTENDFYCPDNKKLFKIFAEMYDNEEFIDAVTTAKKIKNKELLSYFHKVWDVVDNAVGLHSHIDIVKETSIKNQLKHLGKQLQSELHKEAKSEKVIAELTKKIDKIKQSKGSKVNNISQIAQKAMDEIEYKMTHKDSFDRGVITGFSQLDEVFVNFEAGNFVTISALPGHGKSSLALQIAMTNAKNGKRGLIFNMEMSETELYKRMLSIQAEVNSYHFKRGTLDKYELEQMLGAREEIEHYPIHISDLRNVTLNKMEELALKIKRESGLDYMIVDHLGLISIDYGSSRYEKTTQLSSGIKALAMKLDIPIIVLVQLSRKIMNRTIPDRRPLPSDLRDSGSLEQDSDIIMGIYYEYYHSGEKGLKSTMEIDITKHRSGRTKKRIPFDWYPEYTKFIGR